jgi:hypothetical protein
MENDIIMKILITESKRKDLVYKLLDDILNKLTREDFDSNIDSVYSNQQVVFKDNDGDIIMRWSEKRDHLYVTNSFENILNIFSFDENEKTQLISQWFKSRVNIEPDEVYFSNPGSLDWENMGIGDIHNW